MMKPELTAKLEGGHVYILLEHAHVRPYLCSDDEEVDALIHGVYTTRKDAAKASRRYRFHKPTDWRGYLAIIKKPIKGQIKMNCTLGSK